MKVKVVRRIPREQYGFTEVEVEFETELCDLKDTILSVEDEIMGTTSTPSKPMDMELKKEMVKPAATTQKKVTKKKVTKKAAVAKIPKNLLYDREKEEHKKEFIDILFTWDADWPKTKKLKERAGEVSKAMVGKQIYDKEGELLGEFIDGALELMEK